MDSIDCLTLLQSMAPMSYDSSRLIDTACIGFAHVTRPHLASLRAVHEAAVQAQFQVPTAIRQWHPWLVSERCMPPSLHVDLSLETR